MEIRWKVRKQRKIVVYNKPTTMNIIGSEPLLFNDPYFTDQWYLKNDGQTGAIPGNDLNVLPVWKAGFTGRGVILSVLDDGIQHTNPDIYSNYEPSVSDNLVDSGDKKHDPTPDLNGEDTYHGTYCAAIMAAVANNGFCGVGIAYNAKVGGLRVLDDDVTDVREALALTYGLDRVDIYSASWGPKDDGGHMAGPEILARKALQKGIKLGRKGKGSIYVWAVGNGGDNWDNCNMDGYASSIYTVAVSALTEDGLSTYYSEPCASALTSAYVGGIHHGNAKKGMQEKHKINIVVPKLNGKCSETFQGTSAAAPLVAGIIALVLEANPRLTWRDLQHIIVRTSKIPNSNETGWRINQAGHHYHLKYGFGVIDAARMVSAAQQWTSVGKQTELMFPFPFLPRSISCHQNLTVTMQVPANIDINSLEHVIATVGLVHRHRKYMQLFLVSPSKTMSTLLTERKMDNNTFGIKRWDFMSVHFWEEDPRGTWIMIVSDNSPCVDRRRSKRTGTLKFLNLHLYGTSQINSRRSILNQTLYIKQNRLVSADIECIMEMEKIQTKIIKIKRNR